LAISCGFVDRAPVFSDAQLFFRQGGDGSYDQPYSLATARGFVSALVWLSALIELQCSGFHKLATGITACRLSVRRIGPFDIR